MSDELQPLHPALSTMARERLASGVEVFLECYANSDWAVGPSYAALQLDQAGFDRLTQAMRCCVEHGWSMIETNGGPSSWDDDEGRCDLSVRSWNLRASKDAFWFHGMPKEGSDTVESRGLDIANLVDALNASSEPNNEAMPANLVWFGGALVFGVNDVQSLCDMVAEARPDIEAAENALEMNRVIGRAPRELDASEAPTHRTRRHTV
tara:strand:- start:117 stop:740 length:624 start_codon:yes stop_codon:yes gene_type:complete